MKHFLLSALLFALALELSAQCAPNGNGNGQGARFLLDNYPSQTERDAAAAAISSIVVNGVTYNVQAHPSVTDRIRTTPTVTAGTFANPFTGIITLNLTAGGTTTCNYNNNVLPVSLLDFSASTTNNRISLKWRTASEENNEGFEIQQSVDGISFESIGWQVGSGTTNSIQNYAFETNVLPSGQYFFRLKQVDIDGQVAFSKIVFAEVGKQAGQIRLYPNPVQRGQMLTIIASDSAAFTVYNSFGQKAAISDQGNQLNTSNLAPGMYFITFSDGRVAKFIVF